MESLIAASVAFVGLHFLLSHPFRAMLVRAMGERIFLGVYSLAVLAPFVWMILAYRAVPPQPLLWNVGDGMWLGATIAMLIGSVLFAGSYFGNPALPDPSGAPKKVKPPRGVFVITRHPMMWGFAIWGLVHILVFPTQANIVLSGAIVVLALVGAALQDGKKAKLEPDFWPRWQSQTSYIPFAATLQGRAQWAAAWPGSVPTLIGIALWLVATKLHVTLGGAMEAGIWRWLTIS